jgi:hypothetical protein
MTLTKTHEEEQLANSRIMDDFEFAFILGDILRIRHLLHSKGLFFGRRSKISALAKLGKMISVAGGSPSEKNNLHINKGFTKYGAEVLEIRTSSFMNFNNNDEPILKKFGEPEDKLIEERVYRFTFKFKEGKICSIQIPNDIYPNIDKFIQEN